ncbi:MAG: hemerythrin family protein [Candidatus Pacebacteria bacterium]|nr:hemerythrin family protein [Candidatus Paceibacterota bacterium]
MLLNWKKEYSVNVKEIDAQHKKLIEMINELYEIINNKNENLQKEFTRVVGELEEYKNYHFSTEEKYFHQFNYENTEDHIAKHIAFGKKIEEFKEHLSNPNENYPQICFDLLDYLEDWFFAHLIGDDKKYTKTFNENGLF